MQLLTANSSFVHGEHFASRNEILSLCDFEVIMRVLRCEILVHRTGTWLSVGLPTHVKVDSE